MDNGLQASSISQKISMASAYWRKLNSGWQPLAKAGKGRRKAKKKAKADGVKRRLSRNNGEKRQQPENVERYWCRHIGSNRRVENISIASVINCERQRRGGNGASKHVGGINVICCNHRRKAQLRRGGYVGVAGGLQCRQWRRRLALLAASSMAVNQPAWRRIGGGVSGIRLTQRG